MYICDVLCCLEEGLTFCGIVFFHGCCFPFCWDHLFTLAIVISSCFSLLPFSSSSNQRADICVNPPATLVVYKTTMKQVSAIVHQYFPLELCEDHLPFFLSVSLYKNWLTVVRDVDIYLMQEEMDMMTWFFSDVCWLKNDNPLLTVQLLHNLCIPYSGPQKTYCFANIILLFSIFIGDFTCSI